MLITCWTCSPDVAPNNLKNHLGTGRLPLNMQLPLEPWTMNLDTLLARTSPGHDAFQSVVQTGWCSNCVHLLHFR
jgi:hypothetical protein